jgi:hypothetical protein
MHMNVSKWDARVKHDPKLCEDPKHAKPLVPLVPPLMPPLMSLNSRMPLMPL